MYKQNAKKVCIKDDAHMNKKILTGFSEEEEFVAQKISRRSIIKCD